MGPNPHEPAKHIRKAALPHREATLWTATEIQRFLIAAADKWRPVFLTAVFTGLRLGELQAMAWEGQNRPNFATNKIEVTCSYNDRTRRLGPAKSERSVRTVDMVPSVRQALLALHKKQPGRSCSLASAADRCRPPCWPEHSMRRSNGPRLRESVFMISVTPSRVC